MRNGATATDRAPWSDAEITTFAAAFDHHDARFIEDPSPVYEEMRARCPVSWSPRYGGFWLITRYEAVRRAAKDWQTFTSSVPNVTSIPSSHTRSEPDIPIEVDPPLHTRYRQLVAPAFSRGRVERMRPRIEAVAAELLEGIVDAVEVDLVRAFAVPMSVRTLAALIDLPPEDSTRWSEWVRRMYDGIGSADSDQATGEYYAYIVDLIAQRRATPRHDFVTHLLSATVDGHSLSDHDVARFMRVLLIAGHETTAASMAYALRHLAEHPAQWDELRANARLIPTAVEEFLRLSSTVTLQARNATHDVTFGGQQILSGDVVALCFPAANRDPEAFPSAEQCVLDRSPNKHVAFGFGPHLCLGAHVARLELSVMLEAFAARVPAFRIATGARPTWHTSGSVRGLATLPVRIGP
jgi:cytochrome P450